VELGADAIFVDCEHGSWSFEDVRVTAQAIRGAGGAAIVRPHSHERPILIRYLNAGADGLMVPMVDTADQARAIVDAVRYRASYLPLPLPLFSRLHSPCMLPPVGLAFGTREISDFDSAIRRLDPSRPSHAPALLVPSLIRP
jgi:hypothetical protein